jgi:hypothetical protein
MSWTAWGWWVQGCSFPSVINDWNGTPSASGSVVKQFLVSSSGSTTGSGSTIGGSTGAITSTGTSTGSSGTGTCGELVILSTIPKSIKASSMFNVTVGYWAGGPRDIVVDLMDKNSNWYGKGTITVPAGKGSAMLSVKVQNSPSQSSNYYLHAWSVNQGTANNENAWSTAYDNDNQNIVVGNSLKY